MVRGHRRHVRQDVMRYAGNSCEHDQVRRESCVSVRIPMHPQATPIAAISCDQGAPLVACKRLCRAIAHPWPSAGRPYLPRCHRAPPDLLTEAVSERILVGAAKDRDRLFLTVSRRTSPTRCSCVSKKLSIQDHCATSPGPLRKIRGTYTYHLHGSEARQLLQQDHQGHQLRAVLRHQG
jgi:hypothetical protein